MSPSTHTLMLNLIQSHANVSFQFIFLLVIYWPICHNSTLGLSSISSPSPESYMPTHTHTHNHSRKRGCNQMAKRGLELGSKGWDLLKVWKTHKQMKSESTEMTSHQFRVPQFSGLEQRSRRNVMIRMFQVRYRSWNLLMVITASKAF